MVKLVSETGRWALCDNSMIFCSVNNDCLKYHLIDDEDNELPFNLEECCVPIKLPWEKWAEEEAATDASITD